MNDDISIMNKMKPGDAHYRAFVGPPERYDLVSAMQFNLLTQFGLRDTHTLLDIGCGSLRAGRLLIPYLQPSKYYGLEPEEWLIQDGIANEIGQDLINIKKPTFAYNDDFDLEVFGQTFDFIIAQSIFTHTSISQMRACLASVKKVLNDEGLFLVTFIQGDENYEGDEWVYPGIVRYQVSFMQQIIRETGLESRVVDWHHPNQHRWLLAYHPDIKRDIPYVTNQDYHHLYTQLHDHPYVRFGRFFFHLFNRFSKIPASIGIRQK